MNILRHLQRRSEPKKLVRLLRYPHYLVTYPSYPPTAPSLCTRRKIQVVEIQYLPSPIGILYCEQLVCNELAMRSITAPKRGSRVVPEVRRRFGSFTSGRVYIQIAHGAWEITQAPLPPPSGPNRLRQLQYCC